MLTHWPTTVHYTRARGRGTESGNAERSRRGHGIVQRGADAGEANPSRTAGDNDPQLANVLGPDSYASPLLSEFDKQMSQL